MSLRSSSVEYQAIVVDNASEDDTVQYLHANFPEVEIIECSENLGYGRAVNAGVRAGDGDVVFFMNNDVEIGPDYLETISAAFDDDAVAMAGGITINPADGSVDVAGVSFDKGLGLYARFVGKHPDEVDLEDSSVIGPGGASLAFRRAAIEQVGLFDEEFFAYFEDVDLFLRLKSAGWNFAMLGEARAVHLGSASFGARSLGQQRFASWGRGYLAGRYRVGVAWLSIEILVGLADSAHFRSLVPLSRRIAGWRRGRALPKRSKPESITYLSMFEAMKLRLRAM